MSQTPRSRVTVVGTLARVILVPLGLLFGAAAAAFVFLTLGLETVTAELAAEEYSVDGLRSAYVVIAQGVVITSGLTLLPALAFIIVGEVARIRSLLYYMIAGGAALPLAPMIASYAAAAEVTFPGGAFWQIAATAGFFGGFVYWLIAGRTA